MNDVIVVSLVLFLSVFLAASILPKSVLRCKLLSLGLVQPRVVPISSCSIPVFLKCMIFGLLLPLRLHPALVVGHLGRAVGHLPDAQHLKHQDSKRPHIAPEKHRTWSLPAHISARLCSKSVFFSIGLIFKKSHRLVNSRMKRASGAVHLIGNFSLATLILLGGRANPKSAT